MWRFLLLGLLIVSGFVALIVFDDTWSNHMKVPTLPPAPLPLPSPPIAQPVPAPVIPPPSLPALAPQAPMALPPIDPTRARPVPTRYVTPPQPPPPVQDDAAGPSIVEELTTAQTMLSDGQTGNARNLLIRVQARMTLQPVTPNQPYRDDNNMAASKLGVAIRAINEGDTKRAVKTINMVLAGGF